MLPAFVFFPGPAEAQNAEALRFSMPVACKLGQTCWVSGHMDLDPGKGVKDYNCGKLAENRNKGTDISIRGIKEMQKGYPVLAAADGRVRITRDGVDDIAASKNSAKAIAGKECGNGLIIDHPGEWSTQYCHLRKKKS